MQSALDALWPYAGQLFLSDPGEGELAAAGLYPASQAMAQTWVMEVRTHLGEAALKVHDEGPPTVGGREQHSEHLEPLLAEMQSVARLEPQAVW
jgi:ring-1,2-phenylacetyl-CoA epoxidase subunit PaaC